MPPPNIDYPARLSRTLLSGQKVFAGPTLEAARDRSSGGRGGWCIPDPHPGGYAGRHPGCPITPQCPKTREHPKTPGDKACRRRRQARPGRMSGPALTRLKHTEMARKTTRGKLTLMSGDGPKVPNASPEPPDRDDWRTTFRPDIPSSARIYDYFLGGKDNYPADRDAGDRSRRICPIYAKPPKSTALSCAVRSATW